MTPVLSKTLKCSKENKMRIGQEVKIKLEIVSWMLKETMSNFQRYNNPTVSDWNKKAQRVQVEWAGESPMWFYRNQVERIQSPSPPTQSSFLP